MSWADDFYAATNATKTTNVGAGVNTYYDKKFLKTVTKRLRMIPLGQRRPLPEGMGKTIEFFRWLNISPSISSSLLSEGVNPDATSVKGQKIQATLAEYGAFSQVTSLLKQSHIDRNVEGLVDLWAEHAANVLELKCKSSVAATGAMPLRADYSTDTGATYTGTVDSATSTTLVDATLTSNTDYGDANDDLNQSIVTITSGTGYGQQRPVTDYVAASGTMTVPSWDVNPEAGDSYTVVSADGIASGDALTYENIKRARTRLVSNEAMKYADGYFVAVASPEDLELLMDDSKWINAHTYKESMGTGLFSGEAGKFAGVRFIEDTAPFTFPITARGTAGTSYGVGDDGGNYSSTGEVRSTFILGREAFGVTTFRTKGGQARKPNIIVKTPNRNSTNDPLNRFSTVGWEVEAVYKGLNPLFAQQIWTYNN